MLTWFDLLRLSFLNWFNFFDACRTRFPNKMIIGNISTIITVVDNKEHGLAKRQLLPLGVLEGWLNSMAGDYDYLDDIVDRL